MKFVTEQLTTMSFGLQSWRRLPNINATSSTCIPRSCPWTRGQSQHLDSLRAWNGDGGNDQLEKNDINLPSLWWWTSAWCFPHTQRKRRILRADYGMMGKVRWIGPHSSRGQRGHFPGSRCILNITPTQRILSSIVTAFSLLHGF